MKKYLLILLIAVSQVSRAQAIDDSIAFRQAKARLIGYVYTTPGRTAYYPHTYGRYVLDSFVIKYRARRSSRFDYRTLGYFQTWNWENPYLLQGYFPDLDFDLRDSFQTLDLYANRVHYDTLRYYHRDSFGLFFRDYSRTIKTYTDDTTDRLISGLHEPLASDNRIYEKRLTQTYLANQRRSSRVDFKVPNGWRYNSKTLVYANNILVEDTVRSDSVVTKSQPYREVYHYSATGVVDTVKSLYSYNGGWGLGSFRVLTYDKLGRVTSYAYYMLSSKKADSFYTYSLVRYVYQYNTNRLIIVEKYLNDIGQGLGQTSVEQRHLNAKGLPDSVWYRGYYSTDYVKVLSYDSLDNPVSISVYSLFVPQRLFSKIQELRYYYELVPEIQVSPPDTTAPPDTIIERFCFFPNPTKGRFSAYAPQPGSFKWLDMLGKTVAIFRIDKGKNELMVSAAAGVYLGIYISDDGSAHELVKICHQP